MNAKRNLIIQRSIEESTEAKKRVRYFLLNVMLKEKDSFGLDAKTMFNHNEMLEEASEYELEYLRQCICENENLWIAFEHCNYNFDLLYNSNKALLPDRITFS